MNIGQIAKRAGVSRSAVSYALSGKRPVSAATRQRIQEVIAELGYRPNAAARALKEGRTRTLGLVIPPASTQLTHVQLNFVASVVEASARADLDVLLSPSGGDHDSSFERLLAGGRVDGVILMEIRLEDSRVDRLQEAGLPFVGIGHTSRADDMCWIDIDYAKLISQSVHRLWTWATPTSPSSAARPNSSPPATAPPTAHSTDSPPPWPSGTSKESTTPAATTLVRARSACDAS